MVGIYKVKVIMYTDGYGMHELSVNKQSVKLFSLQVAVTLVDKELRNNFD